MDRICGHIMLTLRNCKRNMVKMFTHDNICLPILLSTIHVPSIVGVVIIF